MGKMKLVPSEPQLRLFNAGIDIQDRRATKRDAAYMAREMILCTLPHDDPGDVPSWCREAHGAKLFIQPGLDKKGKPLGMPYGTLPRLLLFWLIGEMKRKNTRKIWLTGSEGEPTSLASFMRELDLNPKNGGERSDTFRLKEAMTRLFAARIILLSQVTDEWGRTVHERASYQVAQKEMLWWDGDRLTQEGLMPAHVLMGQEFFEAVIETAVPCDTRAIRGLKNSSLALDLYAMLNYFGANQPRDMDWVELERRLGCDYADRKDLKKKVKAALPKVLHVHPGLRAEVIAGGLKIMASQPAVPFSKERRVLESTAAAV